jgi:hypothetical protein
MIAAKYRLSVEPKASKFPRHAHTEEVACSAFRFGPPLDKSRMVGKQEVIRGVHLWAIVSIGDKSPL